MIGTTMLRERREREDVVQRLDVLCSSESGQRPYTSMCGEKLVMHSERQIA